MERMANLNNLFANTHAQAEIALAHAPPRAPTQTTQTATETAQIETSTTILPIPSTELTGASLKELLANINAFTEPNGYKIVIRSNWCSTGRGKGVNNRAIIRCDRAGKLQNSRNIKPHERKRPNRTSRRCQCPMEMKAFMEDDTNIWRFQRVVDHHNHQAYMPSQPQPPLRQANNTSQSRTRIRRAPPTAPAVPAVLASLSNEQIQAILGVVRAFGGNV